jgi:hypothetical protein
MLVQQQHISHDELLICCWSCTPASALLSHSLPRRFVEDNWESPVLGAWGLGWEVWLDGMEVTQFTYFQQVRLSVMVQTCL